MLNFWMPRIPCSVANPPSGTYKKQKRRHFSIQHQRQHHHRHSHQLNGQGVPSTTTLRNAYEVHMILRVVYPVVADSASPTPHSRHTRTPHSNLSEQQTPTKHAGHKKKKKRGTRKPTLDVPVTYCRKRARSSLLKDRRTFQNHWISLSLLLKLVYSVLFCWMNQSIAHV